MAKKNPNRDILDLYSESLINPSLKLPAQEQIRLDRLKEAYAHWLSNPLLTDGQMRDYIMSRYQIGRAQAYNDIAVIKVIFGLVQRSDKEFIRYKANHILELAAAAAMAGNDKKAKALEKIAATMVKVNQLDEPEGEELPWDDLKPKDYSFSTDPRIIDIEPEPNIEEKSRKLLAKYLHEIDGLPDEQ